jgi:hypothetical protein
MDLFIDTYFKKEVEDKINYYDFLYNFNQGQNLGSLVIEGGSDRYFISDKSLIVVKLSGIDGVKVRNATGYLQESKITDTAKRFTLI